MRIYFIPVKKNKQIKSVDIDWLLHGKIDKPAYFVCKITALEEVNQDYPNLKEIYRKNGFVFFVRVK
jgi:hypothetical protein